MHKLSLDMQPTFDSFHPQTKKALLPIREWLFEVAESANQRSSDIGKIQECLKWGEPSYQTASPKSGTTLRLSQLTSNPLKYGLFVHCQSSLIEAFRVAYPDLDDDKNRGVVFDNQGPIHSEAIKQFIYFALTYHLRKNELAHPINIDYSQKKIPMVSFLQNVFFNAVIGPFNPRH